MPSLNTIISAENLVKTVQSGTDSLHILQDIALDIKLAESVAIVGASGAGKSTLLGLLAGLDTPSSGKIFWQSEDITQLSEDERALKRGQLIGFVFQNFQLLPNLTAQENVMLPLELLGKAAKQPALTALTEVNLTERLHHYPSTLSGGEQQRVAIARAFAVQPKILFADEPTGNLDKKTGEKIIDLLFTLNQKHQTTLIIVTHDEQLAARCDRQLHLDGGQLI